MAIRLPDLGTIFDDPETEFEKFLATPIGSDPNYPDEFALVYARLTTTVAQLEASHAQMKIDQKKTFLVSQLKLVQQIDPITQKKYSLEGAARIVEIRADQTEYYYKMIELKRRISTIKGYIEAMEIKSKMIPGEQGRLNQWLRAENRGSM